MNDEVPAPYDVHGDAEPQDGEWYQFPAHDCEKSFRNHPVDLEINTWEESIDVLNSVPDDFFVLS